MTDSRKQSGIPDSETEYFLSDSLLCVDPQTLG